MSLNPWDSESYRIHTTDEKFPALWVINGGGGFLILNKRKTDGKGERMDNNKSIIHDELDTEHGTDISGDRLERCTGDYIARRLTPTECARLQGFPPDWAADVEHSDSAEYKMWGNGIALPCIIPMMKAMNEAIREEMALEQKTEDDGGLPSNCK